MRLISVVKCQEGMEVAKTIYNDMGQALIQKGVILTSRMIERLKELGISLIYIQDELTADIEVEDILSEETRKLALQTINEQFSNMVSNGKLRLGNHHVGKAFQTTVKAILDDIRQHKKAIGFLTDVCSFDKYTFQHSLNVTVYSLALAVASSHYSEKQLIEIGLGAILHDVGKLAIPPDILSKPGKLTDDEFNIVKEHTTDGFNLLRKIHELPLLSAHCAFQHHERLDGTGYPRGLVKNEIHEYAKIVAIADVFDALTSLRSYRKAIVPHVALDMICSAAGEQFDPELVDIFKNNISVYPIGTAVQLSNGLHCIVVDYNHQLPSRPIVRIIKDQCSEQVDQIEEIDLSKHVNIVIENCDLVH